MLRLGHGFAPSGWPLCNWLRYCPDGRTAVSGQNVLWLMNGVTLTGGVFFNPLADARWKMVGPR